MPYIPHTQSDVESMLETIGVDSVDELFDEIPAGLAEEQPGSLSAGLPELDMLQSMQERASLDEGLYASPALVATTTTFQPPFGT